MRNKVTWTSILFFFLAFFQAHGSLFVSGPESLVQLLGRESIKREFSSQFSGLEYTVSRFGSVPYGEILQGQLGFAQVDKGDCKMIIDGETSEKPRFLLLKSPFGNCKWEKLFQKAQYEGVSLFLLGSESNLSGSEGILPSNSISNGPGVQPTRK